MITRRRIPLHALFACGALITAVSGTVVQRIYANSTTDLIFHDTYIVLTHFYIYLLAAIFLFCYALLYWLFCFIAKRPLRRTLGLLHFWLTFIAILSLLSPHAFSKSLAGVPRHYYDFTVWDSFRQFVSQNPLVSTAALLLPLAQLLFVFNLSSSMYGFLRNDIIPGRKPKH